MSKIKSENRIRQRKITLRFSEDEWDKLSEDVSILGTSKQEYIRRLLNNISLEPKITSQEFQEFIYEFKKIGNNINQLTHLANMGKLRTIDVRRFIEELQKIYVDLTQDIIIGSDLNV